MGRGSFGTCLVSCVCVLGFGLAALGCQPLYGGKPEKLVAPQKKKPPPEAAVVEAPVKEVDDCTADFHGDPKNVKLQPGQSGQLTGEGDTALANSDKATDPNAQ